MPVLKKKLIDKNVYDAAIERINKLFDQFDKVVISFSGGKDSTACLNLALKVARERNRLPLDVVFWDEEAIHPETIEYIRRVADNPDIRFKWLCIPVEHRNACSRKEPYWYPWQPEKRELWVREMPHDAITDIPGFIMGMAVPQIGYRVYPADTGERIAYVLGLRASESLNRYRSVAHRVVDNWLSKTTYASAKANNQAGWVIRNNRNIVSASPIYDWTTLDVWVAPKLHGWDYNHAYDVFEQAGVPLDSQRVCPPFGEEPLRGLYQYAICWPEMWHKMVNRVHGAATAARYSRTELYGFGSIKPPEGMSWRKWLFAQLKLQPEPYRSKIAKSIKQAIDLHKKKTGKPVPTETPDPLTGISWAYLAMIANRGDLKGRRISAMGAKGRVDK